MSGPLVDACRPKGKTPLLDLRRALSAIGVAASERREVAGHPGRTRAAQVFIC